MAEKKRKRKANKLVRGIELPENGQVTVGEIGVDAGLCWIGDPCYVFHKNGEYEGDTVPKALGKSWKEFCDALFATGEHNAYQFSYDMGHDGLGVAVSTGYGDGCYPVIVTMKDGRVRKVEVKFF